MDTGTPNDAAAASVPTPPAPAPSWPMSVDEFLAGPYLARSDVVLTRKQRDFRSWLIRLATRGSFSHAALVFLVPHQEKGFNNSFVIESASGGVDLSNLADYLKDKRSIVGIKRIRGAATWFDQETAALVRGRMLNSIQAEYAYATAFRIALDFINQIAFGMKAFISGHRRAIAGREAANLSAPNAFICSGLVQLGFVNGVVELIETGKLLPSAVSDVVFREDLAHFLPEDWEAFTDAEQLEISCHARAPGGERQARLGLHRTRPEGFSGQLRCRSQENAQVDTKDIRGACMIDRDQLDWLETQCPRTTMPPGSCETWPRLPRSGPLLTPRVPCPTPQHP